MADINSSSFWANLLKKIIQIILKNLGVRTSPPTHHQHVVPHEEGWAVKGEGNERYSGVYKYQQDAIDRAKENGPQLWGGRHYPSSGRRDNQGSEELRLISGIKLQC
ncbi:MAG: DUF2188 domain-containing protein [Saprospiraceae bacterium]